MALTQWTRLPAFATALKESAVSAIVAAILALPLVGLRTVDHTTGLGIETRFDWVIIGALAVFGGRMVIALWFQWLQLRSSSTPFTKPSQEGFSIPARLREHTRWFAAAAITFAIILPFLPFGSRYVLDLVTTVLIYVMLGWGLNIVVGLAGLLDLGYVGFYAVGAYSFALLATTFELTFWQCLPLAGIFAAFFGVILGFPVLRLRGDYLAIVTLGFGEIIRIVLSNWVDVTQGPVGISGIPRPSFFGLPFAAESAEGASTFHQFFGIEYATTHRIVFLYFLILALALLTNWFTLRIRRLPIGRAWEALREDEIASRALGINPTTTKLTAFAIGAMFGGLAGAFFATRQGFISPESFTFIESATVLAIVVLGGLGSQIGVVLAAAVLVLLPEIGREFSEYRMLLFGLAMILIMIWRPHGLLSRREPTIRLNSSVASEPKP